MMPFQLPKLWLRGALAAVPLAVGGYLLYRAFERRRPGIHPRVEPPRTVPDDAGQRYGDAAPTPRRGRVGPAVAPAHFPVSAGESRKALLTRKTIFLFVGLGLIAWSLGGGRNFILARRRVRGSKPRDGQDQRLRRPDGTEIHYELYGPPDGTPILFVHGLGSDCDEWFEIRERLAGRCRVIDWDLPGLGESSPPRDGDWSLERVAGDLNAVLEACGDRPVVLLGHSLGGMILLTFCRLFPETLRRRVAGLVFAHTTYTNPMKTNSMPTLALALQKPFVEPMCHLTAAISSFTWPVWVLTYLSGEAHRSLGHSLFTGRESREVLDFLATYFIEDRPEAIARYSLAMLRCEETETLATIRKPTLIVVGDRDDSCTPETHAFMRDRIPGARMRTLSPAKHGGLLEYPQQFSEWMEEFAAECADGEMKRPSLEKLPARS